MKIISKYFRHTLTLKYNKLKMHLIYKRCGSLRFSNLYFILLDAYTRERKLETIYIFTQQMTYFTLEAYN